MEGSSYRFGGHRPVSFGSSVGAPSAERRVRNRPEGKRDSAGRGTAQAVGVTVLTAGCLVWAGLPFPAQGSRAAFGPLVKSTGLYSGEHLRAPWSPWSSLGVSKGERVICFPLSGLWEPSLVCQTPGSDWATLQTKPRPLARRPGCLKAQAGDVHMDTPRGT